MPALISTHLALKGLKLCAFQILICEVKFI